MAGTAEGRCGETHEMQLGPYVDHVGLWRDELREWVPQELFDAHVHLGPPDVMGGIDADRRKAPLTTFTSLEWEALQAVYRDVYSGKRIVGLFAFPFPLLEVDIERANDYIIEVMKRDPRVRGFFLAHPRDVRMSERCIAKAEREGTPFAGAKPYFDLAGKDNLRCRMPEFIPTGLLELLDDRGLILMLHTSGRGAGDAECQTYLRRTAQRFARIRIILAHMGRYLAAQDFLDFLGSGALEECPSIFVDMSSASESVVFEEFLRRRSLWRRLLFASDAPYGLITGVERYSPTRGPVFLARDHYPWSDPQMEREFAAERGRLTYNTYHCIKALKDAFVRAGISGETAEELKRAIFRDNALSGPLAGADEERS
ncbi:MAG: amidohydrolase family protein [Planctomycetota bacterium]